MRTCYNSGGVVTGATQESGMSEISDFQRKFFAHGLGNKLFTEQEFVEAVAAAKAEMMAVAIHTSRQVVFIERDACADVVEQAAVLPDAVEVVLDDLRELLAGLAHCDLLEKHEVLDERPVLRK